jgi:hypothetical protein
MRTYRLLPHRNEGLLTLGVNFHQKQHLGHSILQLDFLYICYDTQPQSQFLDPEVDFLDTQFHFPFDIDQGGRDDELMQYRLH